MRRSRSSVAVALLLVLAGGGWSGAEAQGDEGDPCALLTRDEMATISADEPNKPRPRTHKYPYGGMVSMTCTYNTRHDKLGADVTVERGRTAEGMQLYLKTLLGTARQTSGSAMQPVTGYGDQAHWGQINESSGMLHVIKGTDVLSIRTYGKGPGAGTLEKTKELMAIVYPRFTKLPAYVPAAEESE
jgi:hypothetical protein